jgi:hypothetical protein
MLWPFGAACTIVAGSLFLIWGTGAQAWFQIIGYEDVLDTAKAVSSGPASALKLGTPLLHKGRWWFAFIPVIGNVFVTMWGIGLYSAIVLIWLNRDNIRTSGDEKARLKNATRLQELLRAAVPWYLLLLGSSFVLAGAVIQFVLAWPWTGSGPQ